MKHQERIEELFFGVKEDFDGIKAELRQQQHDL